MDTQEFYMKVKDTTPVYLSVKHEQPTPDQVQGMSYWALSFDAFGPFPPVLVHVYCVGDLPPDERRDRINAAIKSYVGKLLTGERGERHIG